MLSIIIPTLQEESRLKQTLEQLTRLTALSYEIIVSDGGSTDATPSIARAYAARVITYTGQARQTIGQARNMGAQIARGDYLVFMDADTVVDDPNAFFSELVALFEQDGALVGATVSIRVSPLEETRSDKILFALVNAIHRLSNNVLRLGSASGEFQMVERDAFERIGGFNERLAAHEDNDLFERLARHGKTRMLPKLRVFHSGRRAHQVGHAALFFTWVINAVWFFLFKRSLAKEWKPIR